MRAFPLWIALATAASFFTGGTVHAAGPSVEVPAPAAAQPAAVAGAASTLPAGGTAADRVLATTPVPDAARKVGDTRLLARGDAVVVQTLLSTKLLSRVIAEIRLKEERNWPDGQPGAEARLAYVEALVAAKATLDRRTPAGPGWTDRRQRLLIEFAADPLHASFTIATFDDLPLPDQPGPSSREVLASREVSRDYVLRNIRLIVADSFHVDENDADRIGPLAPVSSPVVPPPSPAAAGAKPVAGGTRAPAAQAPAKAAR